MDGWIDQLQRLNTRLLDSFSDGRLGDRAQRRKVLEEHVGKIRPLNRLAGESLAGVLKGRPLVGVDGSVNSFGGQFPFYIDLIRALAKPSQGDGVILQDMHCPIPPEEDADLDLAARNDNEMRQAKLAYLEVRAALAAIERHRPALILMDGPLVRFDMRTKDSFFILRQKAIRENILLAGCIENIESRVIGRILGGNAPEAWHNLPDKVLLWGALDYGEVLEVAVPAKGMPGQGHLKEDEASPIRTWFMRSSLEVGVVGLEVPEEQADSLGWLADYLFTLSPADGRGIPIWLDLVDREVRLTEVELEAYVELLDPQVRRLFMAKRGARFF